MTGEVNNVDSITKVYTMHGVPLDRNGSQAKGDCPFCGATAFYVNLVEKMRGDRKILPGFWDCMSCGLSGNQSKFLSMVWEESRKKTTKLDYKAIAEHRGLATSTVQREGMARSILIDMWLIPNRNKSKGLSNLYLYDGNTVYSSPNPPCSQQLLGWDEFDSSLPDVWLVEGHWDKMAWREILSVVGVKANVLGCPGANQFKQKWAKDLSGFNINVVFDDDEPGATGQERTIGMLLEDGSVRPKSLWFVDWPEGNNATGKDIRAKLLALKDHRMVYDLICSYMVEMEVKQDEYRTFTPIPRDSFDNLMADYSANLLISDAFEHCLASALAVSASTRLKGQPLWIYIVGPPSSGKSTICEAMSCSRKYVIPMSSLTANALDSGWQAEGGKNVSLIPMLNGKVFMVKDLTAILTLPAVVQERIFGTLRDANDGVYRSKSGGQEGVGREMWSRFGFVGGVTYDIRMNTRTTVGEKFLQVEIVDQTHKVGIEIDRNMMAINREESELFDEGEDEQLDFLRSCTLGFMEHMHTRLDHGIEKPAFPDKYKGHIAHMAEFCSMMRSQVKRDFKDKMLVRPTREQGSRLSRQLFKQAVSMALVFDTGVDDRVMKYVRRTAMNTSAGFPMDVIRSLIDNGQQTATKLADKCHLNSNNIRSVLGDMKDLGLVKSHQKGHQSRVYSVSEDVVKLWENVR